MKHIVILNLLMGTLITSSIAHAGWFSSKPKVEPKLAAKNFVANDTIVYYPGSADRANEAAHLRMITRGDTATVVGFKVISAVLGGGATGFHKEELRGSEIKEVVDKTHLENPMPLVQASIVNHINKKSETLPLLNQKEYIGAIFFEPHIPSWSLIYDSSDKNVKDGYSLNFGVEISRKITQSIFKGELTSQKATAVCVYKSEPLPLSDWKANDYAQVVKYRQIAAENCTQQLLPKIDQFLTPAEVQL